MSQLFIQQCLNQLAALRKVSGTTHESVLREAFKDLLKAWGKQHDLFFVPEYKLDTLTRDKRYVDGALLYELRVPFGYWEAKDSNDDLDEAIAKKFKRGYPKDNIVFEDTTRAVLIQHGQQVMDCPVDDVDELKKLLTLFFSYRFADYKGHRPAHARNPRIGRNTLHHRGHAYSQALGSSRRSAIIRRGKCFSRSTSIRLGASSVAAF